MHFVDLRSIQDTVNNEYENQKQFLKNLVPTADIQHIGSTAVPGSITKGDIDIQVRVDKKDFVASRLLLGEHYKPNRKNEIWRDGFASFENYANPAIPVGIQLTIKGSKYDEFYQVRDLFLRDPSLLKKYNEMKRSCEGKTYSEYRKHKRELFGVNGDNPLLDGTSTNTAV